jgi:outer membrane lipoprotein
MKKKLLPCLLFLGLLLIVISGCASPAPTEIGVGKVNENLTVIKVLGNPSDFKGEVIVWGGVIMKMVSSEAGGDLYIQATPFDFRGRPKDEEFSEGMFIARTWEFLDPQKYAPGRKVTVAGEIIGAEMKTYEGAPYIYPLVRIREIHLWEKESPPIQWNWWKTHYYWPDEYTPDQERRQPLP